MRYPTDRLPGFVHKGERWGDFLADEARRAAALAEVGQDPEFLPRVLDAPAPAALPPVLWESDPAAYARLVAQTPRDSDPLPVPPVAALLSGLSALPDSADLRDFIADHAPRPAAGSALTLGLVALAILTLGAALAAMAGF